MSGSRVWFAGLLALAPSGWACQEQERPPPIAAETGGDAGFFIDAGEMCEALRPPSINCGSTTVAIELERRNLYFVLDRSGSMAETLEGSAFDKYDSARVAIDALLRRIGHRVHYGAALFPGSPSDPTGCGVGYEVYPTRRGDTLGSTCDGGAGDVLLGLNRALGRFSPLAGTPVAATLADLSPELRALPGQTFVVLATDGAPNCNPDARCPASECMLNLEQATLGGRPCDDTFNCCDPRNLDVGPLSCVDRAATVAEVAALAAAGIRTYVIGMPGSELYSGVLDELAAAGGTARATTPSYYVVPDTLELGATLGQIGAAVSASCQIELAAAPSDPELVNVFFDERVVARNETDGWTWTGTQSLELVGAACEELSAGDVRQVQVLFGCPTTLE